MNTEKVAKIMARVMPAKLVKVEDVRLEELPGFYLIGFGSGIYGYKRHESLFKSIERLPMMDKNVFVFSTSGNFRERPHQPIKEKLAEKGCTIVGEFWCFGEYSPCDSIWT
jgi:flavodoxin